MPSVVPSFEPSDSALPSVFPSETPSMSHAPSIMPSLSPSSSFVPSVTPSGFPSYVPSNVPSNVPSSSSFPSMIPSFTPSGFPSDVPSSIPSQSILPSESIVPSETLMPSGSPVGRRLAVHELDGREESESDWQGSSEKVHTLLVGDHNGNTPLHDLIAPETIRSVLKKDTLVEAPSPCQKLNLEDVSFVEEVEGSVDVSESVGPKHVLTGTVKFGCEEGSAGCRHQNVLLVSRRRGSAPISETLTAVFHSPVDRLASIEGYGLGMNGTIVEVETSTEHLTDVAVLVSEDGHSITLPFLRVKRVVVHLPSGAGLTALNLCETVGFDGGANLPVVPKTNEKCTIAKSPCGNKRMRVCSFSDDDASWHNSCIEEQSWEDLSSVFPSYCGPCSAQPVDPEEFRSPLPARTLEVDFEDSVCQAGKYGVENVDVQSTDGFFVTFTLRQSARAEVDAMQVWYDDPASPMSRCHEYHEVQHGTVDDFTARCEAGWATVNIIAQNGDDFRQFIDVDSPSCQDRFNFVDFNPKKRCYWQLKIPCVQTHAAEELPKQDEVVDQPETPVAAAANSDVELDCEARSRKVDVLNLEVDKCAAETDESPVKLISQDGDSVTFAVSQVWKGCDQQSVGSQLGWIAVDYVGVDDNLECSRFNNLDCGLTTTITASCSDGVSVVDLYTYDEQPGLFAQEDDTPIVVPDACGATGKPTQMCHMRYLLKCEPSKCHKSRPHSSRRLGQKG